MCFDRGVALVVVGFPATPLLLARARVCISASHSREDLEYCLDVIDDVTTKLSMKYSSLSAEEAAEVANGHHGMNGHNGMNGHHGPKSSGKKSKAL